MSKDRDIIPLQSHERVPDTKDVSPGADSVMIHPELQALRDEFRKMRRRQIDELNQFKEKLDGFSSRHASQR
jgi:hypothetical protein